ncbi:MAG: ammonium transporter [Phycisphaerales bacterium]
MRALFDRLRIGTWLCLILLSLGGLWSLAPTLARAADTVAAEPVPDPSGQNSGGIGDVPVAAKDAKPKLTDGMTLEDVAAAAGHNRISINIVWTLITGFLIMFMQAGFAMVEAGLCRAKNAAHTMAMNFMIYPLGMLGFYVCGFAFMFGGSGSNPSGNTAVLNAMWTIHLGHTDIALLGMKGFFLGPSVYDAGIFALFLFQMVFMDTTATIPTGAAAERWKYSAFMLYGAALGTIMYPIYGCWVWGGGWLAHLDTLIGVSHGVIDFAGSSVVHYQGGLIALIFAAMIGPRVGKYNPDGSSNVLPAHNVPMAVIGTFILAFGWFGFNPGSTLAGTDLRISVVAVNTMLASATGALFSTLWLWGVRKMKPDPTMSCNGMLAGLVAITAPCAYVPSWAACLIGLIAGILVVESVFFVDKKLRIDDPVGAISVHGVNGAFGLLSVGIFADGTYGGITGLLYGDHTQIISQIIGLVACTAYLAPVSFLVYWVIEKINGNRVSREVEIEGLDIPEMGVVGYSGVILDKAGETPMAH